nr:putative movement protein [Emaravirus sp.]
MRLLDSTGIFLRLFGLLMFGFSVVPQESRTETITEPFSGSSQTIGTVNSAVETLSKQTKKVHYLDNDKDMMSLTEIQRGNLQHTKIKKSLLISAKDGNLPIDIYSNVYAFIQKNLKGITSVRIADIMFFWIPFSPRFTGNLKFVIRDTRHDTGLIQNEVRKGKEIKKRSLIGEIIGFVSFNPNDRTLIVGGMDFDCHIDDLKDIKFELIWDDLNMKTGKIAGKMEIGWKTVPGSMGVFKPFNWDLFTFEKMDTPELKAGSAKTFIDLIMKKDKAEQDLRAKEIKELQDLSNQLEQLQDGGLATLRQKRERLVKERDRLEKLINNKIDAKPVVDEVRKLEKEIEELSKKNEVIFNEIKNDDNSEYETVIINDGNLNEVYD